MVASKIDKLHDNMPALYNTRNNSTWNAIIRAIGEQDQYVADIIESVRKQFFVKTASRPYIDRLGTSNNVQRPKFVGMDDTTFREFIPIMSYSPKQVKLIFDKLLDLFFFKDSTTSFTQSAEYEPFTMQNYWTLEYVVDGINEENIVFSNKDFTDISNATADEIVSTINRQVKYSYAIKYEDSVSKRSYIRIFTNTIGAKGSIAVTGGLANIGLKFDNFNFDAGNSADTQWEVTVVGDTVRFKYVGGGDPNIGAISKGDYALISLPDNKGSFIISEVNNSEKYFAFTSLFGVPGTFTQTSSDDVKFLVNSIKKVFTQQRRALMWEVKPGEITVEIPPSPPVVKRSRRGAAHINGVTSLISNILSNTSIQIKTPDEFPLDGGQFVIQPLNEIVTKLSNDVIVNYRFNGRLISDQLIYRYTSRVGDILSGIVPSLPDISSMHINTVIYAERVSNMLTVTTASIHDYRVGEYAIFSDMSNSGMNGAYKIEEIIDDNNFICLSYGLDGTATSGNIRIERSGLANDGCKVILRTSKLEPKKHGPYIWDKDAPFVLSSFTSCIVNNITAGKTNKIIDICDSNIPDGTGLLMFEYGTSRQEGPVRYMYKPTANSVAIDPTYIFNYNHEAGSMITKINSRGGITFSGNGSEIAPYVTDPSSARDVLKELMQQIKSVGVFLNFIVRYPETYYGTIDTYRSGIDPG